MGDSPSSRNRVPLLDWLQRKMSARGVSADFRRGAGNAAYSAADHIILLVLWVIATPIFLAKLGHEHYGIWMIINAIVAFDGVLSFGLASATVKYVSKYRALGDARTLINVIRTTQTVYMMLGAVAAALLYTVSPLIVSILLAGLEPHDADLARAAVRLASIGVFVRFFNDIYRSVMHGFERYDLTARVSIIVNALTFAITITLAWQGAGLVAIIGATILMLFCGGIAQAMLVRFVLVREPILFPQLRPDVLREMTSFSVYTWLQSVIQAFAGNLDVIIIGHFVGVSAVAYYAVSRKLVSQILRLLGRGSAFLFPYSGVLFERGEHERLRSIYYRASGWLAIASAGWVTTCFLLSADVFRLWLDCTFVLYATPIVQVLCLRFALLPIGVVNTQYFLGSGLVGVQTAIQFVIISLNVLGMCILTPIAGPVGTAVGQLFSLPIMLFTRCYIERRLFGESRIIASGAYFLVALLPLGAASLLLRTGAVPDLPLVPLIGGVLLAAGSGAIVAFALATLFRRIGWIPRA